MSFQQKSERVISCPIPNIEELCSLNLKLKSDVKNHSLPINRRSQPCSSSDTSYSQTVMRCRKLIFLDILVLASPLAGEEKVFVAILPKSHLVDYRFLDMLEKLDLIVAYKRGSVDPALLETCLKYTIAAKLAPGWNKVGNLFIEGSRFLESRGRLNAVELNVNIRADEACFNMSFFQVTLAEFKLEELVHFQTNAAEFMMKKVEALDENHFLKKWCHVLPSMKKGEIGLVTREMPLGGLFNNYGEMKIYWENMYGYILPERECANLYFQVYFRMLGNKPFTYPSCCLQLHQPIKVPQPPVKAEECLVRVLQNLQSHLPTVCGVKWLAEVRFFRPTFNFQSAGISENKNILIEKKQASVTSSPPSCDTKPVEESTSGLHFPRLNLQHSSESVLKTPNVPSFGIAAAFGSCQQPKLTMNREMLKTGSKMLLPKSSQKTFKSDVKNNKDNGFSKQPKGKPKEFKEDIVLLAQENKLSRVSNVNLLRWLQDMGVPCSSKIRKAELINKVAKFVEISAPEQ